MGSSRPFECPTCGHEGIARAPDSELAGAKHDDSLERWTCRLCGYTWSRPVVPTRTPEIDPIIP